METRTPCIEFLLIINKSIHDLEQICFLFFLQNYLRGALNACDTWRQTNEREVYTWAQFVREHVRETKRPSSGTTRTPFCIRSQNREWVFSCAERKDEDFWFCWSAFRENSVIYRRGVFGWRRGRIWSRASRPWTIPRTILRSFRARPPRSPSATRDARTWAASLPSPPSCCICTG